MKFRVQRPFKDKYTKQIYRRGDTYMTEDRKRAEYLQKAGAIGVEIKDIPPADPLKEPVNTQSQPGEPAQEGKQTDQQPTEPSKEPSQATDPPKEPANTPSPKVDKKEKGKQRNNKAGNKKKTDGGE